MPEADPSDSGGALLANLLLFGRLLRRLGLRISSHQVYDLAQALTHIDLSRRDDFYHAARSFLAHNPQDIALFDRAFDLFWIGRFDLALEFGLAAQRRAQQEALEDLPESDRPPLRERDLSPPGSHEDDGEEPDQPHETSFEATYSPLEMLHRKDFSEFTDEELEAARRFIRSLIWHLDERRTRRQVPASKRATSLDLPRSIRGSMRQGGEIVKLAWRKRKSKPRSLVVICDISGSMERYSRLFLHFMYALVQEGQKVEAFVFGTRLTCITPALRHNDVDAAVSRTSDLVMDWAGGTRIGESLRTFNYRWSRRVLGRGAVAIIISDGWDRGDIALLEHEISRLQRSVSQLIWLNPLMGAPDYAPLVRGIQAVLPHVDDFLPLHNLVSLEQLANRLGSLSAGRRRTIRPDDLLFSLQNPA